MAIRPGILTGASAKIVLTVGATTKTLAYAQDISYSVDVDVMPIEVMGRYEVISYEPMGYKVNGQLSIVRYTKAGAAASSLANMSANGNDVNQMNIGGHFDPKFMVFGAACDIQIFQRVPKAGEGDAYDLNPPAYVLDETKFDSTNSVVKIRSARFTRLSGGISKRGTLVETMNFVGMLTDLGDYVVGNSIYPQDLST